LIWVEREVLLRERSMVGVERVWGESARVWFEGFGGEGGGLLGGKEGVLRCEGEEIGGEARE